MEINRKKISEKKKELDEIESRLYTVEEKWIKDEINKDTYDRWYSTYNKDIINLRRIIERLGKDQSLAFSILEDKLELLTDLRYIYSHATSLQKREFVDLVFDSNLYYEKGIYRTPTMLGTYLITT